jgi:hypothetical protein
MTDTAITTLMIGLAIAAMFILSNLLAFYGVPLASYIVYIIFYAFLLVSWLVLQPAKPKT